MVTHLGTFLGTELGTDLGTFQDGAVTFDASKSYALDSLSTANYYVVQTPATGGELGIAGGGFGVVMLVSNPPAAARRASLAGWNGGSGWTIDTTTTGWRAYGGMTNGSNVFVDTPMGAAGQLDVVFMDAGTSQLTVHALRATVVKSTAFVAPFRMGTAPATDAHTLSAVGNGGFAGGKILAEMSYAGAPTTAHKNALADAIRVLGDIPSKATIEALMPGCTVRKRWSLRDVLQQANVPVIDAQAAPATIPDSVTAASIDAMTKTGSPVVRVIDPSVDGRVSYGAIGFSTASYLTTADPGGVAGAAGGFSIGGRVTFTSLPSTNQSLLARTNNSNAGYQVAVITSNRIAFYAVNGAGAFISAQYQLVAADLGFPRYVECVHTGAFLQIWLDGAKVAEQAIVGYTPFAGPTIWGQYGAGQPLTAVTVYELNAGNAAPTPAQIATAFAGMAATGKLSATPGKSWGIDLTRDVVQNGGPQNGMPAQVLDRVGTDNLTTVGTGLVVSPRTERLWSYETTPIMYGAQNWSAANYLSRAGGASAFLATAVPFWLAMAVYVPSTPGASVELIFGGANGSNPGLQVYFQVGAVQAAMALSPSGAAGATAIPVGAADVGKVLLLGYQWTGTALQSYARRAKVGADVSAASFVPNTNGAFFLGRRFDTTSNPLAADKSQLAVMGGSGNFSLAEWQGAYDALIANERLTAIPGKTDRLWLIGQGGTLGTTPDAMGNSDPITVVGTPTLSSFYARAFA